MVGRISRPVQKNGVVVKALAFGEQDPRPPPTTFLVTKLCLGTYAALHDALLGKIFPFADQVLSLRKKWILLRCLVLAISGVITGVGRSFRQCSMRGSRTVGAG